MAHYQKVPPMDDPTRIRRIFTLEGRLEERGEDR
jgi:hypothetical protein